MPQTQTQNQNQNQETSSFDYTVRAVGTAPGPGPNTVCVVLGLFNKDGEQAVYRTATGEEKPIVFFSFPIKDIGKSILAL